MHIRVLRLVLSGLMGALLVVSKQAMSGLPNIEPVTLHGAMCSDPLLRKQVRKWFEDVRFSALR